jgi:hypothetical protein
LASFTVASGKCVQYDGRLRYGGDGTTFTVADTYENYVKSLADISASLITIVTGFTNVVNLEENYLTVEVDFSESANKGIATHEVFTVTGAVRMKVLAECTTDMVPSAEGGLICLGVEDATSAWIAATSMSIIAANEIWCDSTPTETNGAYGTVVLDKVVISKDVGYQIATASASTGVITFHCWWTPLNATGAVAAGHLSTMA